FVYDGSGGRGDETKRTDQNFRRDWSADHARREVPGVLHVEPGGHRLRSFRGEPAEDAGNSDRALRYERFSRERTSTGGRATLYRRGARFDCRSAREQSWTGLPGGSEEWRGV